MPDFNRIRHAQLLAVWNCGGQSSLHKHSSHDVEEGKPEQKNKDQKEMNSRQSSTACFLETLLHIASIHQ
jgi:hypothetical protein